MRERLLASGGGRMTVFEKIKSIETVEEMMMFFYTHKELRYGMKRLTAWLESEADE